MALPFLERPSFFKVMHGDSNRSLQIPPGFKKYIGENLSGKYVLRSSRGSQWYVKLEKLDGCLFFLDGWEAFFSDHGVSLGDFLVFFYDEDGSFDVKIYGKTGCEKEETFPSVKIKEETEVYSEKFSSPPISVDEVTPTVSKKRKADCFGSRKSLCFKIMRSLKPTDNEAVIRAACSMKITQPHFVATCNHTRSQQVTIPSELVKYCDLAEKKSLTLQDSLGKSRRIQLSTRKDGRLCLTTGWTDFYKEKSLKDGDVCIFEFDQKGGGINIHLFRVEECTPKCTPESVQFHASRTRAAYDQTSNEQMELPAKVVVDKQPLKELEGLLASEIAMAVQSRMGLMTKDDKERIHRVGKLTKDDKERILGVANSFETRHPKFVLVWRKSKLYHVRIPKPVVKQIGIKSNQVATLYDSSGTVWPVDITFRSYGIVEIGRGWVNFSRGNSLVLGDALIFEFLKGINAIYVHILRLGEEKPTPTATDIAEETHKEKLEIFQC